MTEQRLLTGKRILIVDDEPDILETLKDLLSLCTVIEASSFDEAKNLLESEYFDLAVLDIMGVEGYKLLEVRRTYYEMIQCGLHISLNLNRVKHFT